MKKLFELYLFMGDTLLQNAYRLYITELSKSIILFSF